MDVLSLMTVLCLLPAVGGSGWLAHPHVQAHLSKAVHGLKAEDRAFVLKQVEANLAEKEAAAFPLSQGYVETKVIDYEVFKFTAYVSSGVFPKRYFGFVDQAWDTTAGEKTFMDTVHAATRHVNRYAAARASRITLSDAEVAVTFLAEGGALLLAQPGPGMDNVHPVYGIGLDDVAIGFAAYPDMLAALDAEFGSGLQGIVAGSPERPVLARNMTFKEAILGTALMYFWEKERTQRMLEEQHRKPVWERPLDEQFVITSLVYNSGILFSEARVRMMLRFETGAYLRGISKLNTASRGALPLPGPRVTGAYLEQPTSWNAVYHVMQRYGGYVGLTRMGAVWDGHGNFR